MVRTQLQIAIVTHCLISGDGQGRVNLEVAREAVKRGHRLHLIASEVDPDLQEHENVSWYPIDVASWPSELLRNQVFAFKSRRLLRTAGRVDVSLVNGAITFGSSDINAVHLVHSAWRKSPYYGYRGQYSPGALYQKLYTWVSSKWERRSFARTRKLVAVSALLGRQLEEMGIDPHNIVVIPNGVDVSEFYPGTEDRTSLSLPEDVPLALFAGDIRTSRKNLDTALGVVKRVPGLHLAVAGGLDGSPYPAMARQLGIEDRVHFLDYRTDLPRLMRASDLFLFPSRYEPFALVLLEAMASGIPVVTASTVGAATLVGDSGVVLDNPDDVEGMAEAVSLLVNDTQKCTEMGAKGREIATSSTFEAMAVSYVNLFEEFLHVQ